MQDGALIDHFFCFLPGRAILFIESRVYQQGISGRQEFIRMGVKHIMFVDPVDYIFHEQHTV